MRHFDPMLGRWEGEGLWRRIGAEQTTPQRARWLIERALDGSFVRMEFLAESSGRRSPWVGCFRAEPDADPLAQPVRSAWVNVKSGYQFTESGAFDATGRVLTLDTQQKGPQGVATPHRSTFRVLDSDRLSVVDEDLDERTGSWVTTFTFEPRRVK